MIKQLLQFEFFYQRKQRVLLVLILAFFGYGYLMGSLGQGPSNIVYNSPYQISYYTSLMTLAGIFLTMFFSISATIRDKQHGFESIIYSTPIKKYHYFLSRFLAVFIFGILLFLPFFIGHALSMTSSNLDPSRITDFNFLPYFMAWIIFVVPNIFICSVFLFSIALLSKNNIATYVGGVLIYILYMLSSFAFNSPLMAASSPPTPEGMALASLLDPFAIASFFDQTHFWVPSEKNSLSLTLSGNILWNRALWIFISSSLLTFVYKVFSFRQINQKVNKNENISRGKTNPAHYSPLPVNINMHSKTLAFLSMIKSNIMSSVKSLPFMILLLIWVVFIGMDIYSGTIESGAYNDSSYPTTALLIQIIAKQIPTFAIVLLIFFSGELVWRSRLYQFNPILDITPISNASIFLANVISLLIFPLILITSSIFIALLFQLITGYFQFEFDLYSSLYYYQGISLYVYCILSIFIQSLVPSKYLGMAITGVLIFVFRFNPQLVGIEHPMFLLGFTPTPTYSDMNGFSEMTTAFNHFSLYWLSFSLVLALMSFKLLQRGNITSWKEMFKQLIRPWNFTQSMIMGIALLFWIFSASTVFYNTNIVNDYKSNNEKMDDMENYERKYADYKDLDRLFPISINNKVDLYPESNRYTMDVDLLLKNKTDHPIKKVLVHQREKLDRITIEGGRLLERDSTFGTFLFEFRTPIESMESRKMHFTIDHQTKGYEKEVNIVKNGTYITYQDFIPRMGYYSGMEIQDKMERKKRDLTILEEEITTDEHIHNYKDNVGKIDFESIVSTTKGQTVLSLGKRINQWDENDRIFFQFKSEQPVLPTIAYISGKYAIKKDQFDDIILSQYYYPEHRQNVSKISESTKHTLAYCKANFGSYPFDELHIAEVPSHWNFGGRAHPGLISMVEDRLYTVDIRNNSTFDLVAKRTIHEVAHQWWGHQLVPKNIDGGALFVEGFAKYTEAVVLEKMYGKGVLWQLNETANYHYFHGHTYASEPENPIYSENGQPYIAYGKNLIIMLALKDLLGEGKVNSLLRKLLNNYGSTPEKRVTTLDFMHELYAIEPEYKTLFDDWFKRIITYKLSIKNQSFTQMKDGRFKVKITVKANRKQYLENGDIKELEINEPIRFAVLTKEPQEVRSDKDLLYYQLHTINKEITTFTFIVNQKPSFAAIDPYGTRVDENLYNNVVELEYR